jgi:pyrrolysine biosynthesis protein PylD
MTRLTGADVRVLDREHLAGWDRGFSAATGLSLFALACRAAGLGQRRARRLVAAAAAAVVPMDCGQGLIPGFAESVRVILSHLGCAARITEGGEVAGLAEAVEAGCDLVFTADDYRFVALDPWRGRLVDNAAATAQGFVAGLERLAERQGARRGLRGQAVLVIGCGEVGSAACRRLLERGARVALYDVKAERARALAAAAGAAGKAAGRLAVEPDLWAALARHRLLFEASPAALTIPDEALRPDTLVAAPGVPLGVSAAGAAALGARLLHDPLQTGVAVMLLEALRP